MIGRSRATDGRAAEHIPAKLQVTIETNMLNLACRSRAYRSCRSSGFTLVEVLVSILVLSLGLLGMVGLQAASLQANREARLQSAGVQFARDLAELARSNKAVALQLSPADNPYLINDFTGAVSNADTDCVSNACTPKQMAEWQVKEWQARLANTASGGLPGVRARTCFDKAPYDSDGRPQWQCDGGDGAQLVVKLGWTQRSIDLAAKGSDALVSATGDGAAPPIVVLPISPSLVPGT